MKKAQTTVEYILFFLLITVICFLISTLWNRDTIIRNGTFGLEGEEGTVHVRTMTE